MAGKWPQEVLDSVRIRRKPAAKPVAELIGKTLDPIVRKRGLARAELLSWWPDIVGAAYAGRTAPERIRWPRDGKRRRRLWSLRSRSRCNFRTRRTACASG